MYLVMPVILRIAYCQCVWLSRIILRELWVATNASQLRFVHRLVKPWQIVLRLGIEVLVSGLPGVCHLPKKLKRE